MKPSPRVSIGMPVYNGEPYLRYAIESILAQTYRDFELIIADNASTDDTANICRLYAAKDSRIRYFRNHENLGAARNYNLTFAHSRGVYFKWAAADDVCAPTLLEKCVAVLEQDPRVMLCYPKARIIDQSGEVIGDFRDLGNSNIAKPAQRFRQLLYGLRECTPIFGVIRSTILRQTPKIGSYISSDKNLILEISLHGHVYEVPEFLFFRRDHAKASTRAHHDHAGNRKTADLSAWYDPALAHRRVRPWSRKITELVKAGLRAPVSLRCKAHLMAILTRYAFWKRDVLWQELRLPRLAAKQRTNPGEVSVAMEP